VGEAGFAFRVVDGAGVHVGVERDDRGFVAFEDDEVEAVGEGELGDAFFEVLEVLGREGRDEDDGGERDGDEF